MSTTLLNENKMTEYTDGHYGPTIDVQVGTGFGLAD